MDDIDQDGEMETFVTGKLIVPINGKTRPVTIILDFIIFKWNGADFSKTSY